MASGTIQTTSVKTLGSISSGTGAFTLSGYTCYQVENLVYFTAYGTTSDTVTTSSPLLVLPVKLQKLIFPVLEYNGNSLPLAYINGGTSTQSYIGQNASGGIASGTAIRFFCIGEIA